MTQPAARIPVDLHVCPMTPPPGLPISYIGCPTVITCNFIQARMGDICTCVGPPPPIGGDPIVTGSFTVLICGQPAARMGDLTAKGGAIVTGCPTVLIGMVGGGAMVMIGMAVISILTTIQNVADTIGGMLDPGGNLEAAATAVNPSGSVVNCGHIIDAVAQRLTGMDPNATAPAGQDGSFDDIEDRFGTDMTWGSNFQDAYDAVETGGDGTIAIVGIGYSGGGSHVVALANDNGTVGIVEGQNWGPDDPAEVITDVDRANERYNSDGGSNIGWGLAGSRNAP